MSHSGDGLLFSASPMNQWCPGPAPPIGGVVRTGKEGAHFCFSLASPDTPEFVSTIIQMREMRKGYLRIEKAARCWLAATQGDIVKEGLIDHFPSTYPPG